ncbi:hypothetical protein VTK56DRAFT_5152 [Thermocarpiscus australiensis]
MRPCRDTRCKISAIHQLSGPLIPAVSLTSTKQSRVNQEGSSFMMWRRVLVEVAKRLSSLGPRSGSSPAIDVIRYIADLKAPSITVRVSAVPFNSCPRRFPFS